jgi:hypothetical protein
LDASEEDGCDALFHLPRPVSLTLHEVACCGLVSSGEGHFLLKRERKPVKWVLMLSKQRWLGILSLGKPRSRAAAEPCPSRLSVQLTCERKTRAISCWTLVMLRQSGRPSLISPTCQGGHGSGLSKPPFDDAGLSCLSVLHWHSQIFW